MWVYRIQYDKEIIGLLLSGTGIITEGGTSFSLEPDLVVSGYKLTADKPSQTIRLNSLAKKAFSPEME